MDTGLWRDDSQNKRKQKKLGQTIDKLTRSLVKAHIVGIGALGLASTVMCIDFLPQLGTMVKNKKHVFNNS